MRRPLAAALLLLLCASPAAQACSWAGPPSHDFGWMGIDGPDAVVAYVQGGWKRFNVTDGSVGPTHSRYQEPTGKAPPEASAASPDGALRLEPRHDLTSGSRLVNTCWDKEYPPTVGIDLLSASGAVVRRWGDDHTPWSGTTWGNATHGFVWDHGASTLSVVRWEDGSVSDHALQVDPRFRDHGPSAHIQPDLWRGRLTFWSSVGLNVIETSPPASRLIPSPHAEPAFLQRDGDAVLFGVWRGNETEGFLDAIVLDVATGERLWAAQAPGSHYVWTRHGLAIAAPDQSNIRLFRDGVPLAPVQVPEGGYLTLAASQGLLAVATAGPTGLLRLQVFDSFVERVMDWNGTGTPPPTSPPPETDWYSTASWSSSLSSDSSTASLTDGTEGRGAPGLAWPLLAVLVVAAAARRLRRGA